MALRFHFVGDICLAGFDSDLSNAFSVTAHQWQDLTRNSDLTVANLESCIIRNGKECSRFVAASQADSAVLTDLGIDVLSLANNHTLDCGGENLEFMRAYLQEIGIRTTGAGRNIEEASAPLILERGGMRIGIIATTDATHYKAKRNRAGISPLSLRRIKKSIRDVAADVDLLILCIHSDLEFTNYPAPWKVRLSRRLAKFGADIIVHHHPHTLQGMELYEGTLIAYSLGNFIFPFHGLEYMENREGCASESVILEVDIEPTGNNGRKIRFSIIPITIDKDNVTRFAKSADTERIIMKMSEYSDGLGDRKKLRKHYMRLCLEQARRMLRGTYYTLDRDGIAAAYNYLRTHFATRMHRNWMRGILTLGWF